ncbi:hypothetical protein Bca52824_080559 [Brassica carinata]|uniref:Uncharacterized protein n=1 Tax=Brassica carinata TaxID=52824 RepID=A0A8X7PGA8_BRACI|nr:hypothetical protein Bca52824_080559 [Brassica carinata]
MAMVVKHISMSLAMETRAMVSRGELTFQDIHGAEALLNEEDEDGYSCDWEPVQQKMPVEFVKWCCFSCTMANPVSAIIFLRHGYFASLLFKRHSSLTEVEEKCGGNSSATSSTAVGFEEIMLLHSEVYASEHVNITSQLLYRFEFTSTSLPTHTNKYSAPAARITARLCADLAKEIFS